MQVLTTPVPRGYPGRPLTSTEVARIRDRGGRATRSWSVMREVSDADYLGRLLEPYDGGHVPRGLVEVIQR